MKKILFFILFSSSILYAQNVKEFYLVEKEFNSINFLIKDTLSTGRLSISLSQKGLNDYLSSKKVTRFEKAFNNTKSDLLKRTYLVQIDDSTSNEDIISQFSSFGLFQTVEYINKVESLMYTNDFEIVEPIAGNALELVRAPMAWEITKGSSNVRIGIADSGFNIDHEDLKDNIVEHYGYVSSIGGHGTAVAGYASATTDNGKGISSIGYNTKMVTYDGTGSYNVHNLAQKNGVRVINMSWGSCRLPSVIEQEAYREIVQNFNVMLVAAGGNGGGTNGCINASEYVYPASYDHIMAVSSVGANFPIGSEWINSNGVPLKIEWKDVHLGDIDTGASHQHNDKIDIVAPGYALSGISSGNTLYGRCWGTSCAAPQVAAAAALVLSINPLLTPLQVENILRNTADDIYWIPYNQPYIGQLGSGRLNVYRAAKETQCNKNTTPATNVDLLVKDTREDIGQEPNNISTTFSNSQDIWVRRSNDGILIPVDESEKMFSQSNQTIKNQWYVYVRITNTSCKTTTGLETATLYWQTSLGNSERESWPESWNGVKGGGVIGNINVPILKPGQETIIEYKWIPNFGFSNLENIKFLAGINENNFFDNVYIGNNVNELVKNFRNYAMKVINKPVSVANKLITHQANLKINSLSPNPTNNFIELVVEGESSLKRVVILDILGNSKYDQKLTNDRLKIDLSNFNNGIYTVNLFDNLTLVDSKKIIKK